jgi:hypothetical protein
LRANSFSFCLELLPNPKESELWKSILLSIISHFSCYQLFHFIDFLFHNFILIQKSIIWRLFCLFWLDLNWHESELNCFNFNSFHDNSEFRPKIKTFDMLSTYFESKWEKTWPKP